MHCFAKSAAISVTSVKRICTDTTQTTVSDEVQLFKSETCDDLQQLF